MVALFYAAPLAVGLVAGALLSIRVATVAIVVLLGALAVGDLISGGSFDSSGAGNALLILMYPGIPLVVGVRLGPLVRNAWTRWSERHASGPSA